MNTRARSQQSLEDLSDRCLSPALRYLPGSFRARVVALLSRDMRRAVIEMEPVELSIVLPVFNALSVGLPIAVRDILKQTDADAGAVQGVSGGGGGGGAGGGGERTHTPCPSFELCVCDDGSSDGGYEIPHTLPPAAHPHAYSCPHPHPHLHPHPRQYTQATRVCMCLCVCVRSCDNYYYHIHICTHAHIITRIGESGFWSSARR